MTALKRPSIITALLLLLSAHQATARFSLANFTPRIQNLPTACNTTYFSPIPNCSKDDFGPTNDCSSQCIEGLIETSNAVNSACKGVDVPDNSVVGVFLLGQGIQALCNVPVATISSRTSSASPTSATDRQQSSTRTEDDDDEDRTSTAASSTETSTTTEARTTSATATPTTSSTRSLIVDPSPSSMTFSTVRPTAQATQTERPDSQQANSDSGGGSPFDAVTGSASSLRRRQEVWSLVCGAVGLGLGMVWI